MAGLTAFYDANVLYPAELRNLLMHLALTGLLRAKVTICDLKLRRRGRFANCDNSPNILYSGERRPFSLRKAPDAMEVQFEPDVQAKLEQMARESGRPAAELVRDAVAGYVDELAGTRQMLNSRYDDIKSGKVKLIDGDEAFARLHERIDARRTRPA
ncbi:MAG: hypothetical protein ACKV22_22880 [Bryobacteraceae bacterium]